MKSYKRILTLTMLALMLFALAVPAFAEENAVMPRYNNLTFTNEKFVISDDGLAMINYICEGYQGVTTRIVVTVKLQKQFWWWWNDVNGASWTYETTNYCCDKTDTYQLSNTGTYKAIITYNVYGTGGEADVITRELEYEY